MDEKIIFGTAVFAALLVGAVISSIPTALAVFQLDQSSDTQLYPVHMGPPSGYMPNQYGPYGGYQGYGSGYYGGGSNMCSMRDYGYYPYGQEYQYYPDWEEYPQPRYWNYTD